MTTTKSPIKVANRYAALVDAASEDGLSFDRAKRPTMRDCEELSALIDAHRAARKDEDTRSASVDEQANEQECVANIEVEQKACISERLSSIEEKRAEARRKFETATKASTAHGYALIAAASKDGDRMANMRAKLAELPEAVRAGACKLAASKLVPPGSKMQSDLRALFDEQPVASRETKKSTDKKPKNGKQFIGESATAIRSAGGLLCVRGLAITERIGCRFIASGKINENGKLLITLVEQ